MRAPLGARWRLEVVALVSFHSCHTLRKQSISAKPPTSSRVPSLISSVSGLDIAEQSLRDVFNDVSKYIGNISISLNAVFTQIT
jgi:hypothetical protein